MKHLNCVFKLTRSYAKALENASFLTDILLFITAVPTALPPQHKFTVKFTPSVQASLRMCSV